MVVEKRLDKMVVIWAALIALSLVSGIFFAQVFVALGGLLAIIMYWRTREGFQRVHPLFWTILAAVGLVILSVLFNDVDNSKVLKVFRKWGLPFVGFISTYYLMRKHGRLEVFAKWILVAGVFSSLAGITQTLTGVDFLYGQEIFGPVVEETSFPLYFPNGLVGMQLTYVGIQLCIFLFLLPHVWRKGKDNHWLVLVGMFVILFSIIFAFKRGAWVALVGSLGLFFLTRGWKQAITMIVVGCSVVIALWFGSGEFRSRVDSTIHVKQGTNQVRLVLWDAAWHMGLDHPVLGTGFGSFRKEVPAYLPEDLTPYLEHEDDEFCTTHAHNDYLHFFAVTGVLGLGGIVACFFVFAIPAVKELRRKKEPSFVRDLYAGGLMLLVGQSFLSLTQVYLTDGENVLLLGCLIGAALAARERWLNKK